MKAVTGLIKETAGVVSLENHLLKKKQRLQNSFFVQQDSDYQLYAATVWDEIMLNMPKTKEAMIKGGAGLSDMNLSSFKDRHPASLSGGQKQRLLIAIACIRERPVIVLDEPTSGLDGRHMQYVADMLIKLAASGKYVLLITHDSDLLKAAGSRVLYLNQGCICL